MRKTYAVAVLSDFHAKILHFELEHSNAIFSNFSDFAVLI